MSFHMQKKFLNFLKKISQLEYAVYRNNGIFCLPERKKVATYFLAAKITALALGAGRKGFCSANLDAHCRSVKLLLSVQFYIFNYPDPHFGSPYIHRLISLGQRSRLTCQKSFKIIRNFKSQPRGVNFSSTISTV